MKEKEMRKILVLLLAFTLVFAFAACSGGTEPGGEGPEAPDVFEMPADLAAFVDAELAVIAEIGEAISGEWADQHVALIAAGDGQDNHLYWELKPTLDDFRVESGAYYVYCMVPDENGDYLITVDGSEEPDDWMVNYGFEVQFGEAWDGEVAPAGSGWDDDVPIWSCFAPVYNSGDEVVAIVGIDMPCEILEDYPEWNRDRDQWNGLED
jgi:hypothetical protein